jgi:hypothetical protein
MPSYGLLRVVPGSELKTEENTELQENTPALSNLVNHIRKHWEINRHAKLRIEEGLLEDLRARNGEYHPQKLTAIRQQGGSEIYMMITATKQRAAANWIKDIAIPADEKAWGLEPTPMPELPQWAEDMVLQRVQERGGDAQEWEQLREYMSFELQNQARASAEKMETKIEDQLAEAKWGKVKNELIDDFTTFPACICKGPIVVKRKQLKWKQGFGTVKPSIMEEGRPEFKRVSPFDIYPSPEAETVDDGHLFEHIRFARGELYNMIGVKGYKDAEIRKVLESYRDGYREWLWQDTERHENENKHHWWRDNQNGLIDGLHYWGSVQGSYLQEWGIQDIKDPQAEYQIDAILINDIVIRCVINNDPLARRPYHKACYDPIPSAFWGNSIRYLMNDIQEFCNAAARSLVNNMAMASGPQVEVNYERLSSMENELDIHPWKIWQSKGSEMGGGNVVNFFQPDSNAAELMGVYEKFEIKADDATSIPRYSHGNEKVGGAGSTASGLSMLMNSAAKGIKAAIGNFDYGVTRPCIEMMYYYNMITTKDPSIQGDCKVVARGANALLLKDMAQMRRNEFLALTSNEIDMGIIGVEGRAEVLRNIAKDFDMDGIVPTRETIRRQQQELKENPPPSPEEIKMQAEMQIEEIKQQGEADRAQIEFEFKNRQQQLDAEAKGMEHQRKMLEIEAKKEAELDKQARDEAMKIRMMQEETARIIERAEINAETELQKHELTMEGKEADRRQKALDAEKAAAEKESASKESDSKDSKVEKQQPMVLNVQIDNGTGKVKKTIEINRDKKGQTKSLSVDETRS